METLISYKNDPKLKKLFVAEIEKHRKADQIIKGTYGDTDSKNFKGCAVGCSIHSLNIKLGKSYDTNDHSVYETELGMPEWLARLEDTLFEGMPKEDALLWPTRFAKAVPVGANLNPIKWQFCAFVLKENVDRVLKLEIADDLKEEVVKAIQGVISLHENAIHTGEWDESAARSAESAAWSAESAAWSAESAAWSAASAAWSAASAAWSAESAARSAESAAWSAARSAARSAERSAAYTRYADELIRLLKNAK